MTQTVATRATTVHELPIAELLPAFDFRIDDNPDELAALAESIAQHGVLQPLLVRRVAGQWEIVAGRRRLAAARQAGLDTVPCVERDLDEDQAVDATIAENLHRRNLSPIEEGLAYAHLRDQGCRGPEIARRAGRSTTHVYNLLKLLEYPEDVRAAIHTRRLSYMGVLSHPNKYAAGMPEPGQRQGTEEHPRRRMDGDEAALVSYWRRRHDRLLGGLYAIDKARPADADEVLRMIQRLIKLDAQPFGVA